MRISSALTLLLLAGCGQEPADPTVLAKVEAEQRRDVADNRVPCAHGSTAALKNDCTFERTATAEGLILTLRHPDGAFRRLLVTTDGRGVTAADGAEAATVSLVGANRIAVAIGDDRYELPATVKATSGAK
jgi:hypothetical protein